MRPAPNQFEVYSVIDFYPDLAATANARFNMLCISHGDGDTYSWQEGGGEFNYTVKKRGDGQEVVEEWPKYVWDFTARASNGDSLKVVVDCIASKLLDENGDEYPPKITNQVFRAILDAAYEIEEEDARLPYFSLPDGSTIANRWFQS